MRRDDQPAAVRSEFVYRTSHWKDRLLGALAAVLAAKLWRQKAEGIGGTRFLCDLMWLDLLGNGSYGC